RAGRVHAGHPAAVPAAVSAGPAGRTGAGAAAVRAGRQPLLVEPAGRADRTAAADALTGLAVSSSPDFPARKPMGSFSIWHWLIVLVIVVLVFGTKRLKNVGKDLGEAVKGFKQGVHDDDKPAERLAD